MCQAVDDLWFENCENCLEPTVPDEECWYELIDGSDECMEQWFEVDDQCYGYTDEDY